MADLTAARATRRAAGAELTAAVVLAVLVVLSVVDLLPPAPRDDTDFTEVPHSRPLHRARHRTHRRLGDLPHTAGHAVASRSGQPAGAR